MQTKAIKFTFTTLLLSPVIFLIALGIIANNINRDAIKKQLSDYILAETGLRLNVLGEIKLELLPRLNLRLENAELYTSPLFQQKDPLLRVMHMTAVLNPISLFRKKVRMSKIYMDTVQIHLKKDTEGRVNWQPLATPKEADKPPVAFAFNANTIMLKHLNLRYDNEKTKSHLTLIDGHLLAKDIELANPIDFERMNITHLLRDLSIVSRLRADNVTYENRTMANINVQVSGNKHQFTLSNIEFDFGGGHAAGSATADLNYFVPQYHMQLKLSGIESLPDITHTNIIKAQKADVNFNLHTQGNGKDTIINQTQGDIDLHAMNGSLRGLSIETIAEQIKNSFIRGRPLSINDRNKTSRFNQFNAHMTLHSGILDIQDAQLTNPNYSLHTHGQFNFKNSFWRLYLLLNLTNPKYRDIQVELDEFFIDPLRNALPGLIMGSSDEFAFNMDTDFVDVSKTILGKSTSQFLRNRGYKLYDESAFSIRKQLYSALYSAFNDDDPAEDSENNAKSE